MAKLIQRPVIEAHATITLNEAEMGALDALAGYGTDTFLRVFYKEMGKSYLEPHEAGLRSLFEAAGACRRLFNAAADARAVFEGKMVAKRIDQKDVPAVLLARALANLLPPEIEDIEQGDRSIMIHVRAGDLKEARNLLGRDDMPKVEEESES